MRQKIVQNFGSLFGILLLILSIWAISNELQDYHYSDVISSFQALPVKQLYWAIGLTGLGYFVMTGYDILAFRYIGYSLAYSKIAVTGFISCAFGNTVGFAVLTGGAIRYRFYSVWRLSAIAIAQIIAFVNFTFWLGLLAVSGVMFLLNPLTIPTQLNLPFSSVRFLGMIFMLVVAVYLLGSLLSRKSLKIRQQKFRFPSFTLALAQIGVSSLDWILAAAVLYVLLPANTLLSYSNFLGIYLLAMTAGVISNVPGGLGVFETVILLLLKGKATTTAVLASLLAYRGVYYLLPLAVATGLLGFYEIRQRFSSRLN
ncbi:MAG TPA: hypothetical protein V6D33_19595 [Cyanophyceae cyanobacterium]